MVVPLAVGLAEFLQALVPIVVLIIWVLSQVFGAQVKRAPPAGRPRPEPPPADAGPAVPRKSVADEIEEFLRRLTAPPVEKADVDVSESERAPARLPAERPLRRPLQTESRMPMDAEAVDQAVAEVLPTRGGVADSVTQHLGEDRLADHAERLGEDVRAAQDHTQRRIQQTFGHAVGRIEHADVGAPSSHAKQASTETSPGGTRQAPLTRLLQNRDGVRQAIVLHAILERPEHRW